MRLMTRYYFHIQNGTGFTPDDEGLELADLEAVRAEAVRSIRSMIAAEAVSGRIDLAGRIEVVKSSGEHVLILPFAEAFDLRIEQEGRSP